MNRKEITDYDLNSLSVGTIFKVPSWDSDDFHEWKLIYIKGQFNKYYYLGGGMDNGFAIGKVVCGEEIINDANECDMPYIKICNLT